MAYSIPLSTTQVKQTLDKFGLKPNKLLGQNFLVDANILQKILTAADVKPTDTVLEVGPGLGILTQALAKEAKQVIAVEKDRDMAATLAKILENTKNVKIIQGDILKTNADFTKDGPLQKYKVIANLPYYITSPVIRKFLEAEQRPELMVLMVQKEVAQRICAKPPRMSLLAVSVQFYAKPEIVSYVKRTSFWPRPNVDSAILKIVPSLKPARAGFKDTAFFGIVRAGFKQPRKQLLGNLSKGLDKPRQEIEELLSQNNISPNQRAETLSVEDWVRLANSKKSSKKVN